MKTNKFLLFALLPLTCFSVIEIFLLPLRAYSRENNISKEKKENFTCEKYYKLDSKEKELYHEAQAYCDAVVNSKIATDEKIWRNLTPIVSYNERLKWENENDKVNSRVLVISWKNPKRYRENEGKETTTQREIWVTVVPDLHDFCKKYDDRNRKISLPYRLNQVLGLPPEKQDDNNKRRLVEIWVKPKDLFRPTPDPEISDREAELDFPQTYSLMFVSYKYKYWFLNQLMTNDNPWTKLGYTYDWGNKDDWDGIDPKIPKRPANVGLSEFIIREDAPIKIKAIHKAKDYCKKKHTVSS